MSSEQKKRKALKEVAVELEAMKNMKADSDAVIQGIYFENCISDKMIQRAIKKAAQAIVKKKTAEVKAESDEISELCRDDL